MAETLTYENTQEVTTIDNLNEEEQQSLKVGEAMEEAQESLLAGKYKDAQELEKAYVELQKKLGEGEEASSETEQPTDAKQEEETEDKIKELTKATIRCIPIDSKLEDGVCVFSGKPSKQRVLFAKAY